MNNDARGLIDSDPAEVVYEHPDEIQAAIERAESAGRDAWATALRKARTWAREEMGE